MAGCLSLSFYLVVVSMVTVILAASTITNAQDTSDISLNAEGRLIRHLIDTEYDPRQRPLRSAHDVVYVDVLFVLFALFELDARRQVVSGSAWVELMWEDPRLSWNETKYDGIQYLNLDPQTIWMPRVIMQNSAMESVEDPFAMHHSYAILFSDGYIRVTVPARFVTFCLTNVVNFPFDNQTCTVTISSPSMPGASFTPRYLISKMGSYVVSNQWEVGLGNAYETVHIDNRIKMNYSKIHFDITLKRKPYYFVINLVLPSSLINAMSLFAFWVPLDCGEKLSTAVSLLLGVVVFQIVVTDMLPVSDGEMPLLARYIFVNFLVSCGCVLSCIITLNVYKSARKIRSRFWRAFWFGFLAKIVCVRNIFAKEEKVPAVNHQPTPGEIGSGQLIWRYRHGRPIPSGSNHSNPSEPPSRPSFIDGDRCPSRNSVSSDKGNGQEKVSEKEEMAEMEVVAEIINRIIFLIFFILYLCFLIYWFIKQNALSSIIWT